MKRGGERGGRETQREREGERESLLKTKRLKRERTKRQTPIMTIV